MNFVNATITVPTTPATNNPISSYTPNVNAAVNPSKDHNAGMITTYRGILIAHKRMPKVNIVVGHGAPNVGAAGNKCPNFIPTVG